MKKELILIVVFLTLFSFCTKDRSLDYDYFAFGIAHGECIGNCARFFLIQNSNIYPDDMDYYNSALKFQKAPLPTDKYIAAKKLIDDFPEYLKYNPNKTFGCPDCADQGGIHIEIKTNDKIEYWHIDMDLEKQPAEIRDYIQEMLVIIDQLQ